MGSKLLGLLSQIARDEKLARAIASILPGNLEMQKVCEKLGFTLVRSIEDSLVTAVIELS